MTELSMRDLFPACIQVLNEHLRPLHYAKELTPMALNALGVMKSDVLFHKEAENVREKLLLAGQYGTFYTGPPLYCAAFRHWFQSDRQLLLAVDHVEIPGNARAGAEGAHEALQRYPYMFLHNKNLHNTEVRYRALANGLVIEQHVTQWFEEKYPEFYAPPDNHRNWRMPCSHDFKLKIGRKTYLIDVCGPDKNGLYGRRGEKKPTDLHLECRMHNKSVFFEGVIRGENFKERIDPATIFSPIAFLVWLNCSKYGIKYGQVAPGLDEAA